MERPFSKVPLLNIQREGNLSIKAGPKHFHSSEVPLYSPQGPAKWHVLFSEVGPHSSGYGGVLVSVRVRVCRPSWHGWTVEQSDHGVHSVMLHTVCVRVCVCVGGWVGEWVGGRRKLHMMPSCPNIQLVFYLPLFLLYTL